MALIDGLLAYWTMNELSGSDRADSIGSLDLTETGGAVGHAAGKIGNAASFSGTVRLKNATPTGLHTDNNIAFTISLWFYATATTTSLMAELGTTVANNGDYEWEIIWADSKINFYLTDGIIAGGHGANVSSGALLTDTWYHVLCDYDQAAIGVTINNGTRVTTAYNLGGWDSTHPLVVGAYNGGEAPYPGRVDELGIWGRLLTSEERTSLYNDGAGLSFGLLDGVSAVRRQRLTLLRVG